MQFFYVGTSILNFSFLYLKCFVLWCSFDVNVWTRHSICWLTENLFCCPFECDKLSKWFLPTFNSTAIKQKSLPNSNIEKK